MEQIIQSIIKKLESIKSEETDTKIIRQLSSSIRNLQKIGKPEKFAKQKFLEISEKLLPWIIVGEKCFKDIIHLWTSDK